MFAIIRLQGCLHASMLAAPQSWHEIRSYKSLAMGSVVGNSYLYATDFHNGTINVFDSGFSPHTFVSASHRWRKACYGVSLSLFGAHEMASCSGSFFSTYTTR